MKKTLQKNWPYALLLLAAFIPLHLLWLDKYPYGLNMDEVGMAYDAWSLANYGIDRNLMSWPVYLNNFGGGQSVMYAYLVLLLIKLTGSVSTFVIRLPAALFGLMTMAFGCLFTNHVLGDRHPKAWVAFGLFYLACPYFTMAARFGLDCNLMLGMSTCFLYAYLRAAETKKTSRYVLAGVAGGLTLYTYALSYAVLPVFLLLSIVCLLVLRRISFKQILAMGAVLLAFAWPLMLVQYVNMFDKPAIQLGPVTITKLTLYRTSEFDFTNLWWGLKRTLHSTLMFDPLPYNTNSTFWTLYPISIPFVLLGAAVSLVRAAREWKAKRFGGATIVVLWGAVMVMLGCVLGNGGANANRLNAIFFVLALCALTGVYFCIDLLRGRWKRVAAAVVCATYAVYFGFFAHWYFTQRELVSFFSNPYYEAVAYIEGSEDFDEKTVVFNQPPCYYMLASKVSPWTYNLPETDNDSNTGVQTYDRYVFLLNEPETFDDANVYVADVSKTDYCERLEAAGFEAVTDKPLGRAVVYAKMDKNAP